MSKKHNQDPKSNLLFSELFLNAKQAKENNDFILFKQIVKQAFAAKDFEDQTSENKFIFHALQAQFAISEGQDEMIQEESVRALYFFSYSDFTHEHTDKIIPGIAFLNDFLAYNEDDSEIDQSENISLAQKIFDLAQTLALNDPPKYTSEFLAAYHILLSAIQKNGSANAILQAQDSFNAHLSRFPLSFIQENPNFKIQGHIYTAHQLASLTHFEQAQKYYIKSLDQAILEFDFSKPAYENLIQESFQGIIGCENELGGYKTTHQWIKNYSKQLQESSKQNEPPFQYILSILTHFWAEYNLENEKWMKAERLLKKEIKFHESFPDEIEIFTSIKHLQAVYALANLNLELEAFPTAISYAERGIKLIKKCNAKQKDQIQEIEIQFKHLIAVALCNEEEEIEAYKHFSDILDKTTKHIGHEHQFLHEVISFDFLQLLIQMDKLNEAYRQKSKLNTLLTDSIAYQDETALCLAAKSEICIIELEIEKGLLFQARTRLQNLLDYIHALPEDCEEIDYFEEEVYEITKWMEKENKAYLKDKKKKNFKTSLCQKYQEDPLFKLPNANTHHYALYETISISTIKAYEQEHEIYLPAQLSDFFKDVGNGGAGPENGLYSIPIERENSPKSTIHIVQIPSEKQNSLNQEYKNAGTSSDKIPASIKCVCISSNQKKEAIGIILEGSLRDRIIYWNSSLQIGFSKQTNFNDWYQAWLKPAFPKKKKNFNRNMNSFF